MQKNLNIIGKKSSVTRGPGNSRPKIASVLENVDYIDSGSRYEDKIIYHQKNN